MVSVHSLRRAQIQRPRVAGRPRPGWRPRLISLLAACSLVGAACGNSVPPVTAQPSGASSAPGPSSVPTPTASVSPDAVDWPMYLGGPARTAASTEMILSPTNVSRLAPLFTAQLGGAIASAAAVVQGVAYVGSWDGYEYAVDASTGAIRWKTFLGITTNNQCQPSVLGVTSSAAAVDGTVYVGGGDGYWYALDAATGLIRWRILTGDPARGYYNWAAPLISGGSAYLGLASDCDKPLIRGQLLRVDLASHKVVATFNAVPARTTGGSVWQPPSLDVATNTVFVTNGNGSLSSKVQPLAESILALDATTLAVRGKWQVPAAEAIFDGDWATAPILFTDSAGRQMVAAANKNGNVYGFLRTNLAAGPLWRRPIAVSGICAICDEATNSSLAFGDGRLYSAGGRTTVGGTSRIGAIRALDPDTGAVIWEVGTDHAVIPSSAYDNGLVVAGVGPQLVVLDAATGALLYSVTTGPETYASPSLSGGKIFIGSINGSFWIVGLPAGS